MYKRVKPTKTTIKGLRGYQGEPIEAKMRRVMENKEPITDGAEAIYTERKDGVQPAYNIRTDRFEYAVEAKDKIARSFIAKREAGIADRDAIAKKAKEGMKAEGENTQNPTEN